MILTWWTKVYRILWRGTWVYWYMALPNFWVFVFLIFFIRFFEITIWYFLVFWLPWAFVILLCNGRVFFENAWTKSKCICTDFTISRINNFLSKSVTLQLVFDKFDRSVFFDLLFKGWLFIMLFKIFLCIIVESSFCSVDRSCILWVVLLCSVLIFWLLVFSFAHIFKTTYPIRSLWPRERISSIPNDVYTIWSDTDVRICILTITPIVLLLGMFDHTLFEPARRTFWFLNCKSTEWTNYQSIKYLFPELITQF